MCQRRDFGDDTTEEEKLSWRQALVSSAFHSLPNFGKKPNYK